MNENKIEVYEGLYDRILELQKMLQKKHGNEFGGEITISDTLEFLFHEFYYYWYLREYLCEIPKKSKIDLFKHTAQAAELNAVISLCLPIIDAGKKELMLNSVQWKNWNNIGAKLGRIDQEYLKEE